MAINSYQQLQKQIEALQKQAEEVRQEEVAGVIAKIKEAISSYDLQPSDLFGNRVVARKGAAGQTKSKQGIAPKFADGKGGTWVGRGPRPLWLRDAIAAGRTLEEFAVGSTMPAAQDKHALVLGATGIGSTKSVRNAAAGKKAPAKKSGKVGYADGAGNTWSGFGRQPQWLKDLIASGRTLDSLKA